MSKIKSFSILKFILYFVVLLILLIGFSPMLISTKMGNNAVIKITKIFTSKKLSFNKLSISWIGPQEIHDFALIDSKGNDILSFKKLQSNWHPFLILSSKKSFGKTTLEMPMLYLTIDDSQPTSSIGKKSLKDKYLPSKNKGAKKEKSSPFKIPYSLNLDITDGTIIVNSKAAGKASFTSLNLDLKAMEEFNLITLNLNGNTIKDAQKGQMNISSHFDFGSKKTKNIDNPFANVNLEAKCSFKKIPIPALEEVLFFSTPDKKGILKALLGPSLDSDINIFAKDKDVSISLNLKSQNLSSQIIAKTESGNLKLSEAAVISLNLNQEILPFLSKDLKFNLPSDSPVTFQINQFEGPLNSIISKSALLAGFSLDASISMPNIQIQDLPTLDKLSGESIQFNIKGPNLNQLLLDGGIKISS